MWLILVFCLIRSSPWKHNTLVIANFCTITKIFLLQTKLKLSLIVTNSIILRLGEFFICLKISSKCHYCSNVWNNDSNAFSIKLLDFLLNVFFYGCVDVAKIFKDEIYLFSFGQSVKNIIMFKIRYFCMRQKMMWNNVVNVSHSLCQQVQLWKLYK